MAAGRSIKPTRKVIKKSSIPQYSALDPNKPSKGQQIARDARLHRGYSQLLGGGYTRTSSRPYPKSAKTGAFNFPQQTVDAVKANLGIVGAATGIRLIQTSLFRQGGGGGGMNSNKTK